jgi:hypothetical protein
MMNTGAICMAEAVKEYKETILEGKATLRLQKKSTDEHIE